MNNYTNEDIALLEKLKCKYIIYGYEIAPTTGTPHLQGFVIWRSAKTFTASQKSLPNGCHISVCKGNPYQNFVYCSKTENFTERGDRPEKVGQGKRTDLKIIKDEIEYGTTIKELLKKDTIVNYQELKYAENLKKYYEQRRTWKPTVKWYYGPTGTGKTKTAYEEVYKLTDPDNIYTAMDTGKWWDGYDGEEYIIIDDMRKDFLKFHQLLKLLDRYAYRVETKGSTRQFLGKHIIITSAYHPLDMFETREDIQQLIRRIDEIKLFDGKELKEKTGPIDKYITNQ